MRDDYIKKSERCEKDLQAYLAAKKNHPMPELNSHGVPQWNGSIAQKLLKEAIAKGEHKGVKPAILWAGKPKCQVHSKQAFRDHIYQEARLLKFNHYLDLLKKKNTMNYSIRFD